MKRFMTFYCLLTSAVLVTLLLLSSCGVRVTPTDATATADQVADGTAVKYVEAALRPLFAAQD